MYKYTYITQAKREYQYLKEREGIIVICQTSDGYFLLDCIKRKDDLFIDFFKTLILQHEGPTDALVRIMEEKSILYGEHQHLGKLYPTDGDVSCYHVFLAKRSTAMAQGLLAMDFENLLSSIERGLLSSDVSKQALVKLLK